MSDASESAPVADEARPSPHISARMRDNPTLEESAEHRLPMQTRVPNGDKDGLPGRRFEAKGETTGKENRKHTDGYGEWPECELCGQQVEPTLYNTHINAHAEALRA